jgi:hypothetical protein
MTHISDNLHIGQAPTGIAPQIAGGRGFGPVGRTYVYDIVPLALNASAIAASQSPGSAALTLSAGTGVTAVVVNGQTRYTFDVPRTVTITSGGVDTGINFLVRGFDTYGNAMSEAITGASSTIATGKKAFMSVISITPSGAVASTVTAGTSDVFGLPVALVDAGYIASVKWNETLTTDAGTFVAADNTSPATTTTGDVRGTYKPSANASNGVRRLVILVALSSLNIGTAQTVVGVLGQPQV